MKRKRTEYDSLGAKKIDNKRLWGAQTQRSKENFNIGSEIMPREVIIAIGYQKKAAALTNMQLGILDKKIGNAIIKACDQIINSKLFDEFPLSVWQTGSGTQTNMNANEVISNVAIKSLKGKIGSKNPVHPNDHVNLSQSSNDTFPTIMHLATDQLLKNRLLISLDKLIKEFKNKSLKFNKIIKIGRTHYQDATPITLGQEFSCYLEQLQKNKIRIINAKNELSFLPQGGTAVGNGINAPKNFDKIFCRKITKLLKTKYSVSKNKFASIATHDAIVNLSGTINTLAVSLIKISNDIRFLASGPRAGISELILPNNEPGSSIMPGKINPTQIEALTMVCAKVMGNHMSISYAGSQGHLELNTYKPLIIYNIIQSINLLSDSMDSFNKNCLSKIKPNKKNINKNLNNSLMLVTALNNHIGYDNAAKIAKKAFKDNISLKEAALKLKLISSKKFDQIVDVKKMI